MIPNIVHFVWPVKDYKGSDFHLVHRLAIKSAIQINKPDNVYFWCETEPEGDQWDLIKNQLQIKKHPFTGKVFDNDVRLPAHKSDILRLYALVIYGGVYLDIDTICVNPWNELLRNTCVIGEQNENGDLCNAVIMADNGNAFIRMWTDSYRSFNCRRWSEHSVKIPTELNRIFKGMVKVEPQSSFFEPSHGRVNELFELDCDITGAYILHLWASHSWNKYLKHLTEKDIIEVDTTYNKVARKFL